MSRHIFSLVCLIGIFLASYSHEIEDRLSPIQVQSDNKPETPMLRKNSFQNYVESLKGKAVESSSSARSLPEHMEYDSLDDIEYADEERHNSPLIRGKKNIKQWDHWGKWSECSVTCGVGKSTRWRHCISDGCAKGEKEAQIKSCTMRPCP